MIKRIARAAACAAGLVVLSPSPALASSCSSTAFKPVRLASTTFSYQGTVRCNKIMDILQIKVCEQRHRKDGSDVWDNTACQEASNAGRSTLTRAFSSSCGDGWYYRTAVWWSGVSGWWGGADIGGKFSAYAKC
jgi:hypothetical protein